MLSVLPTILASAPWPWLPEQASSVARDHDWLFNFVLIITVFFSLLIFVLMAVFAIKYRHKKGVVVVPGGSSHSTALEITWTIIPTILVLAVFYYGFRGYLNSIIVPPNAYEIVVTSQMWKFGFRYPNGYISPNLVIPKGVPVRLVLTSEDVIHAMYVPAFRLQKMNVPGRYNRFWVEGTVLTPVDAQRMPIEGEGYHVFCAMYCGTSHSEMRAEAYVLEKDDFKNWLEFSSDLEKQPGFTPAWAGQKLSNEAGCFTCHSVDGTSGTGPSWKDLFGEKRNFTDGTSQVADEDYIRESIQYPAKKIVASYGNVMPSYLGRFKDKELGFIIAYMKTISSHYKPDAALEDGKKEVAGATSQPTTAPVQ